MDLRLLDASRGLLQHGAHKAAVFVCRLYMQQHCLELWTRRLAPLGAGHKDYFLVGYVPRRPGGVGGVSL